MATCFVKCDNCAHKTTFANMSADEGNGMRKRCVGCKAPMLMRKIFPNELRGMTAVRS